MVYMGFAFISGNIKAAQTQISLCTTDRLIENPHGYNTLNGDTNGDTGGGDMRLITPKMLMLEE